jgi:pimeloyl-ACP methyl ester carboxylesterase
VPVLDVDGVAMSYERFGRGEPVVLVAGLGMPALMWNDGLVPALTEAGYEVITFDNRGIPPSGCPPAPYTLEEMRDETAALIEHLDVGPVRLVGYSMGGSIAQELALVRPELIEQLVLIGTRARHTAWLRASLSGAIDLFRAAPDTPLTFLVPYVLAQMLDPARLRDDVVAQPLLDLMLSGPEWNDPGRIGQYEAYLAYDDRLDALGGVASPTLVMAFADDLLIAPRLGEEVAATIPGARFEVVEGQGHWGVLLGAEEVATRLERFFAGN